jgi:hypothetical protein
LHQIYIRSIIFKKPNKEESKAPARDKRARQTKQHSKLKKKKLYATNNNLNNMIKFLLCFQSLHTLRLFGFVLETGNQFLKLAVKHYSFGEEGEMNAKITYKYAQIANGRKKSRSYVKTLSSGKESNKMQ